MILNDDQKMIRDTLRDFARERLAPYAAEWARNAIFPAEALKELATMVATGKLKYRESVAEGLESAPQAFIGLLRGRNFGKQLVKLT